MLPGGWNVHGPAYGHVLSSRSIGAVMSKRQSRPSAQYRYEHYDPRLPNRGVAPSAESGMDRARQ